MEEMKVCPFCGKEILAVAKMCKYCREWLPEEPVNAIKSVGADMANTKECAQDNNHTETDQASGLSSEERDARIEELKNERRRMKGEKMRANREGKDVSDIVEKICEIDKELHKLDVEKGLEEGYWERTADGTIISKKVFCDKKPFWKRLF